MCALSGSYEKQKKINFTNNNNNFKWESIGLTTIKALVQTLHYLQWNSIDIIAIDEGWWLNFAYLLQNEFEGIKRLLILPLNTNESDIENKLESFSKQSKKVMIFCGSRTQRSLHILELVKLFHRNSFIIVFDLILHNSWSSFNKSISSIDYRNINFLLIFSKIFHDNKKQSTNRIIEGIQYTLDNHFENSQLSDKQEINAVNSDLNIVDDEVIKFSFLSNHIMTINNQTMSNLTEFLQIEMKRKSSHKTNRSLVFITNIDVLRGIQGNYEEMHENCDNCWKWSSNLIFTIATASILIGFLSLIIVSAIIFFRKFIYRDKKSSKNSCKIMLTMTDFEFPQNSTNGSVRRIDEGIEAMLCVWLQQLQEFGGPEVEKPDILKAPIHVPKVRYNGDTVHMKFLPNNNGDLKSKAYDFLVCLHSLRHENINPFIGFLTNPPRSALVFEWSSRGSLVDVLIMDEIKLDWSFRLSLLTDLVRGMRYLHSSIIRVHGALTSKNCVIDARWVLKITDYGLNTFYDFQGINLSSKSAKQLLWTAPEILRQSSLGGTQSGDVYSFAIIMQEVVVRGEPYCMLGLSPEEIIEKLRKPPPLIRPSVSKGAAPPEAINIMRQCWAEHPDMRPDFNAIFDLFKKLNHGRKVNFVDTMFQLLEKYSNNLEELIRERTEQLDLEKKKTEQLLNRMLPNSVAEKLKLGMPVDPEAYQDVTIYFSDIVGFTEISAISTPFQVVDLLNDLYTCFDATINAYNVYKIETIGDAYMVVAGVPTRILDHAEQIATMALDLLHQSGRFRIRHLPNTPLQLRIGLHSGPCCAGVVGLIMPRYCLFGDTVNTASRMESTGLPWRIHLSETTKDLLEQAGGYDIQSRGVIDVKGKGLMHTYWLLGKDGFDKELPVPSLIKFTIDVIDEHNKKTESTLTNVSIINHSNSLDESNSNTNNYLMVQKSRLSLSKESIANFHSSTLLSESYTKNKTLPPINVSLEDLSKPYSQYKCISPNAKGLQRQYSLDRCSEIKTKKIDI